jgi:chromosomal replication initiation ATPase DnaA
MIDKKRIIETTLHVVAEYYGITPEDLKSKNNTGIIAQPRHKFVFLICEWKKSDGKGLFTLDEIGEFLNGRDHATMINSRRKVGGFIVNYSDEKIEVDNLRELVKIVLNGEKKFYVEGSDYLDQECSEMLNMAGVKTC